ncbi:MAG: hypothetical protein NZL85_12095, partial [Fimbriimonadales bacterium]|nr:hypothetical protein [Fimbriimonadales bacterium]
MLMELMLSAGLTMQASTYKLQPFLQDRSAYYTVQHGLPDAPVHALVISGESLWVGTPKGIATAMLSQPDRWRVVASQPARLLVPDGAGGVYGVAERELFHLPAEGNLRTLYTAEAPLIGLQVAREGGLWLLTPQRLLRWQNGAIVEQHDAPTNRQFRWFHQDTRGRLFAFAEGELERSLYRLVASSWQKVGVRDDRGRYYDDLWLCAVSDSLGHLWIGARSGLILGDGDGWWLSREAMIDSASSPTTEL